VLSYNFKARRYEPRIVTNKWYKGVLPAYRVTLNNGYSFICTADHKLFVRWGRDNKLDYAILKVKDIDLDAPWYRRQLYFNKEIYIPNPIDIDPNLAYITGIYIAEGYYEEGHVRIAQDKKDIVEKIRNSLKALRVSFKYRDRKKHNYFEIKTPWLKTYLKSLGTNSFNKKFPYDVLNWSTQALSKLLEGLLDGDGTDRTKYYEKGQRGAWEYSTSSDNIAEVFPLICRRLGFGVYKYYQVNHKGAGKRPIYRFRLHENASYNASGNITTVGIKSIEPLEGEYEFYDIEVETTHSFILAESGIVSHNCEDFSALTYSLLLYLGLNPGIAIAYSDDDPESHAFTFFWCTQCNEYYVFSNKDVFRARSIEEAANMLGFSKVVYKGGVRHERRAVERGISPVS